MRISDLSSDVCSSDLYERQCFVVQGNSAVAGIPVGGALVFGVDDQHNPADLGRDANASAPDRAQELTPESFPLHPHLRSEERRGGTAGVSKCRSRRAPDPKKNHYTTYSVI